MATKPKTLNTASIGPLLLALAAREDVESWSLDCDESNYRASLHVAMHDGRNAHFNQCDDIEAMLKAAKLTLPYVKPEEGEEEE